jgi:hypothetical protein
MDILIAAGIELPCPACGGRFTVTLRQILLSQEILTHEGCPTPEQETECPPALAAGLLDRTAIEDLQRAWSRLETEAHTVGGRLSVQ